MTKFEDLAPDGNDWVPKQLKEILGSLEELRSARSGEAMSIGAGGLVVKDSGSLRVELPNGVVIFYAGRLTYSGTSYQGIIMRHADGSPFMFTFPVNGDPNNIAWKWLDADAHELVSSDAITGGLARPWMPLQGMPVLSSSIPMTANASYISTWSTGSIAKQQPFLDLVALCRSESGATGNARFTIDGTQVGTVMPIAANSFGWKAAQTVAIPGKFYSFVTIELEVQRTNAVGTVGGVFTGSQRQT